MNVVIERSLFWCSQYDDNLNYALSFLSSNITFETHDQLRLSCNKTPRFYCNIAHIEVNLSTELSD